MGANSALAAIIILVSINLAETFGFLLHRANKSPHQIYTSSSNANEEIRRITPNYDDDTVRVRIWRTLIDGRERNLKDLSRCVGVKPADVRHHLKHVEKQAKTLPNKSLQWRERRGLPASVKTAKLKYTTKQVGRKRRELFVQLVE
jgi:hypothetical protein